MIPEEFNEEVVQKHASDMMGTGSSFEEISAYLQGKGMNSASIEQVIARAAQEPLRKQLRNRIIFAAIGLLVGLAFYAFALYLQRQQEEQISQLIEQGKGISMLNGEYVMLGDPDRHMIVGFSAIFGLFSAFGAFKTWRLLKSLKQTV